MQISGCCEGHKGEIEVDVLYTRATTNPQTRLDKDNSFNAIKVVIGLAQTVNRFLTSSSLVFTQT